MNVKKRYIAWHGKLISASDLINVPTLAVP